MNVPKGISFCGGLIDTWIWNIPNPPALWFLYTLFLMDLCYSIIRNISKKSKLFLALLLSIVGYILSLYNVHLIFRLEILAAALSFYLLGNSLKDEIVVFAIRIAKRKDLLFLLTCIQFVIALILPKIDIMGNNLHPFYMLIAMMAIVCFIGWTVNERMYGLSFWKWLALNAIVILALHSKIFWLVGKVLNIYSLSDYLLLNLFVTILAEVIIIYSIASFFDKYCCFLVGKK